VARDEPGDLRSGEEVRDDVLAAPGPPEVSKDRRHHGGMPDRIDDDELAERVERERADAGLTDYAPGDVPPATDDPAPVDLTQTDGYRDEVAEVDRQVREGAVSSGERPDFPPTRYPQD
jgi:hypothetical protein